MTPAATTNTTRTQPAALEGRAKEYIRRSYRTPRIGPLVGVKGAALILDIAVTTVYLWIEPGSDIEATAGVLEALVAAGTISEQERAGLIGLDVNKHLRVNRPALKAMIARLEKAGEERAARMLSECTHMIPPVLADGGPEYGAALGRRAEALRMEIVELAAKGEDTSKVVRRFVAVENALKENEKPSAGRMVWLLEDLVRFGEEIGRIRAPVGKARGRASKARQ
jgi:hypothetical protein